MSLHPDDTRFKKEPHRKVSPRYEHKEVYNINNDLPVISLFFILFIAVLFYIIGII